MEELEKKAIEIDGQKYVPLKDVEAVIVKLTSGEITSMHTDFTAAMEDLQKALKQIGGGI